MTLLAHFSPWQRLCVHTTAVREHLDYCNFSLSDIVCNFYMVDEVK